MELAGPHSASAGWHSRPARSVELPLYVRLILAFVESMLTVTALVLLLLVLWLGGDTAQIVSDWDMGDHAQQLELESGVMVRAGVGNQESEPRVRAEVRGQVPEPISEVRNRS